MLDGLGFTHPLQRKFISEKIEAFKLYIVIEEREAEMKYEPGYGYAESWGSKGSFLYTIIK